MPATRHNTRAQLSGCFPYVRIFQTVVEFKCFVDGTKLWNEHFTRPLSLTFAMVKAASIKELDLRYGDIGNIQGRVYFLHNTKTPEPYHEKHTNYLRVFTQINKVLWELVTLLLMHSNMKILIKLKNMVEMRTDASSFHQSLLLNVLTTILFPTGKHGSSGFIGPRLLNRY